MKRVVCIGDSITYGQLLPDHAKAWPERIQGFKIISAGVPGDTTRLALERFPQTVQRERPDITIIQFGHNDCNRWQTDCGLTRVSLRSFEANLYEMIQRCTTFGSLPLLCTLTPSTRNDLHARDTLEYSLTLRNVAVHSETMLIDVRSVFLHSEDELLMPDGIHLNEEGHRLYADTVQRVLDSWR